jgi:hypothetical protein
MVKKMASSGKKRIEATLDVEKQWGEDIWTFANATLVPKTKSVSSTTLVVKL